MNTLLSDIKHADARSPRQVTPPEAFFILSVCLPLSQIPFAGLKVGTLCAGMIMVVFRFIIRHRQEEIGSVFSEVS